MMNRALAVCRGVGGLARGRQANRMWESNDRPTTFFPSKLRGSSLTIFSPSPKKAFQFLRRFAGGEEIREGKVNYDTIRIEKREIGGDSYIYFALLVLGLGDWD